ncbi:LysR family transcriptional regulator [Nocardia sp. alder85J]|uniref:LysR family transcriptional regulator n=1 Tax=Nocardia sp. alder85J TaxID=2862949 RepID=UPI001CD7DF99|nr:LysR family transcriptional regulator [Nocardia sp. alder85J]MCX4092903.1 LysR family transcriptional regulator [Nocardia sp. alder85J]
MQLRQLSTFRTVADALNVTRAAERLNYAQSSVTDQIKALEQDLGVHLFERSNRGLRLTPAGHRLLDYAERMLSLAEEARAAVTAVGSPGGELVIGAPETLCAYRLPALLTRFREDCPNVRVVLRPGNREWCRNGVREGSLDVCFTFGAPPDHTDLDSMPLLPEPVVVVAPRDHPLTRREVVTNSDLAGVDFLVTEPGCSYRLMFEEALGSAPGPRPRIAAELTSIGALRTCVAGGMGCALLPQIAVAADLARGTIGLVAWRGPRSEAPIHATWRRDAGHGTGLLPFLDATRTLSGGRPDQGDAGDTHLRTLLAR